MAGEKTAGNTRASEYPIFASREPRNYPVIFFIPNHNASAAAPTAMLAI